MSIWKPDGDDNREYWIVSYSGEVYKEVYENGHGDAMTIAFGNAYETKELAEKASKLMKINNLVIQKMCQTSNSAIVNHKANNNFSTLVGSELANIETMLIDKNAKYGNSALEPKRIFSKASSVEQILVRIDDKLSRMATQSVDEDEDVVQDLLGYLILLRIAQKKEYENV